MKTKRSDIGADATGLFFPLGFPVTRLPKAKRMRAYAIVAKDEPLLFGRRDNEFYGAIWIYPSKKIANSHCGGAGKVIRLEVSFIE